MYTVEAPSPAFTTTYLPFTYNPSTAPTTSHNHVASPPIIRSRCPPNPVSHCATKRPLRERGRQGAYGAYVNAVLTEEQTPVGGSNLASISDNYPLVHQLQTLPFNVEHKVGMAIKVSTYFVIGFGLPFAAAAWHSECLAVILY